MFLQGRHVRVTFKDRASCNELVSSGLFCGCLEFRVFHAVFGIRSVYVRNLASEISDDDVKIFSQAYGDVLSVSRSTLANFPALSNLNRVVELALDLDIPYFVTICDYKCRVWYARQPAHCTICGETGYRGSAFPLSGLCRRWVSPVTWLEIVGRRGLLFTQEHKFCCQVCLLLKTSVLLMTLFP